MSYEARALARRLEMVGRNLLQSCKTCGDHPTRIICVDPETDVVWSESIPASGCPDCGRAPDRDIALVMSVSESGESAHVI